MDTTTTNSVDSLKMENVDYDELEEKVNDIKVEKLKFEDMDMPDYIDIKKDVIEKAIKQEELIIKSESQDFYEGNINRVERKCSRSPSVSEDESTSMKNANHGYDIETMQNPQLENHKEQREYVGVLSCGEGDYKIKKEYQPKSHKLQLKSSTEIEMFSCGVCNYQAKFECDIKAHMLVHKGVTEVEIFSCGKCDYQTKYKNSLNGHILRHKREKEIVMFTCGECNYQTKFKQSFKTHMLQHKCPTRIEMFRCGECHYQTKFKNALTMHNKLVHKSATEIEIFKYTKNLDKLKRRSCCKNNVNKLRHKGGTEIEIFCCDYCDFLTKNIKNFQIHMLKHRISNKV